MNDDDHNDPPEAFRWLDAFFDRPMDQGSPDEAFDWICMMHDEDWRLLEDAWKNRPAMWRDSCAYILGEGPTPESLPLLRRALFDTSPDVATTAASSFAAQRLNNRELVELDDEIIQRLRELIVSSGGKHMEEVVEVLDLLDSERRRK